MPTQTNNHLKKNKIKQLKSITIGDLILISIGILSSIFFIPYYNTNQPSTVNIYLNNTLYAEYPLNKDHIISLHGHEGDMKIEIENKYVSVLTSTCREQICVKSGKIKIPFQQLVCVPNHILIEIKPNKGDRDIDAIAK